MTKENATSQTHPNGKHPLGHVETVAGAEEGYQRAQRQATALIEQGFHLGGVIHIGTNGMSDKVFDSLGVLCLLGG
jgi:hypothetical protein